MDDENCMAWSMTFHPTAPIPEKDVELLKDGNGVHAELIPGTFRPVANRDNDYLIDRAKQKSGRHYNGVRGLAMQDASVQESIGVIADRSHENLVSTDNAIILARQRLAQSGEGGARGGQGAGARPGCATGALRLVRPSGRRQFQGARPRRREVPQRRAARGGVISGDA